MSFFFLSAMPFAAMAGVRSDWVLPEAVYPDLREMLAHAGERSWRMGEEDLRVLEARGERAAAQAAGYPSLTGSARLGARLERRSDFDETRSVFTPQAGLTLRQPLYQWGAIRARQRTGALREALANDNRREAHRLLLLEIRSLYLAAAVTNAELAVAAEIVEKATREKRFAKDRVERGELPPEALPEKEWAVREAELRHERLQGERRRLLEDLARLSGTDPRETGLAAVPVPAFTMVPELDNPPQPSPLQPALAGQERRIGQTEEQLRIERASTRPRVDLVAGVLQDQVPAFDRDDIDRTVGFAGIEVTWNLFDGYESQSRRMALRARQRLEERRLERMRQEQSTALSRLAESLSMAGRELRLAEERLERAERDWRRAEEDHRAGTAAQEDKAEARLVVRQRELAVSRERAAYLMLTAEYLSEAGIDPWLAVDLMRQR